MDKESVLELVQDDCNEYNRHNTDECGWGWHNTKRTPADYIIILRPNGYAYLLKDFFYALSKKRQRLFTKGATEIIE